jgi:hypothetical protein
MWVKDDTGGTYWDGHDEFRHMVEEREMERAARCGGWMSSFILLLIGYLIGRG